MKTGFDFLSEIAESKRARVNRAKRDLPLASLRATAIKVRSNASQRRLRMALHNGGRANIIAEIKRASPSKGDLGLSAAVEEVATAYSRGGAAAVSVLTEEDYFRGSLDDVRSVRSAVAIPVLRKDFIFDEYQVYESAAAGADALLLITSLLNDAKLELLLALTERGLGMDALVEVHTQDELRRAINAGATLIGVNNRNLSTFDVSLDVSRELISKAPRDAVLVSESGLRTASDLKQLRGLGYRGFLIGEALVRAENAESYLRSLISEAQS